MAGPDSQSLSYRPDIDGLRAIAVLAVIGFHGAANLFPGGYVGVDIFFVISGFLITSIICRQLRQGSFSFSDFYARRCKRIFPALIVVLVAVLAYGWVFLLPGEYERLGRHTVAGAGFVSNFVFWTESGYFDNAAHSKPLLHLWSLGIEEQFYMLWPPILVWAWRRKWDAFSIGVGLVSISFAVNVILVSLWQAPGMYYLPPARIWELLLGGILAYVHLFRREDLEKLLSRAAAVLPPARFITIENIQATAGLFLILVAVVALNEATLFPGWWALLPTVGALLLISAGPQAWINRHVLASRRLVFIGLISYPLYLWHWPLLSYAQIMTSGTPPGRIRLAAIVAAFLLAWLTYRWVELPVRTKPNPAALVLLTSLTVVALAGVAVFSRQLDARSANHGVQNIVEVAAGDWGFPGPRLKSVHTPLGYHFERGNSARKVLFVGDSHMEQYYPRIDDLLTKYPHRTKGVVFVTQRLCAPVPDMTGMTLAKCSGLVDNALSMAQQPGVDTVVIGAAWNRYDVFRSEKSEVAFRNLAATIANYRAMGRQVYLVLPIPRGEAFDPSSLVTRSLLDFGFVIRQEVQWSDADATVQPIARRLAEIANSTGAAALDPMVYVCRNAHCPTLAADGLPIYADDSHLRPAYVREHVAFFDAIVSLDEPSL